MMYVLTCGLALHEHWVTCIVNILPLWFVCIFHSPPLQQGLLFSRGILISWRHLVANFQHFWWCLCYLSFRQLHVVSSVTTVTPHLTLFSLLYLNIYSLYSPILLSLAPPNIFQYTPSSLFSFLFLLSPLLFLYGYCKSTSIMVKNDENSAGY